MAFLLSTWPVLGHAEEWYESLESSTVSTPVTTDQSDIDRKEIEKDLVRDISRPREIITSPQGISSNTIVPGVGAAPPYSNN